MLSLLLDENISPEVARQLNKKRPDRTAVSVHSWREGRFKAQPDEMLLAAAAEEGLTLVTYDQKTIMPLLLRWGQAGTAHAGVIFVDHLTIAPHDFGALIRALVVLWERSHGTAWTDAVAFLKMDSEAV